MTDKLIEQLRDDDSYYRVQEKHWCIDSEELERQRLTAADRIEALTAEVERLRLDVEAQEALQVSAYHAGLKAGWNFCVDDNHEGQQAAMASTDHIKELRRIREARAALKGAGGMTDEFVEFPMSNDKAAQDRAYWYRQGKDDGIEQERGNIVEWLRKEQSATESLRDEMDRFTAGYHMADEHASALEQTANAIERGDHLK